MKIRTKSFLGYVIVVVVMLAALFLISNKMISSQFEIYAVSKGEEMLTMLEEQILERYAGINGWNQAAVETLANDYQTVGITFDLLDEQGKIVMVHDSEGWHKGHQHGHQLAEESPLQSVILLDDSGDKIGTLLIYTMPESFLSRADLNLRAQLGWVFVIGAVVALLSALAAAYFLSKDLTKPIQAVSNAANIMANGDYSTRVKANRGALEISALAQSVNTLAQSIQQEEMLRKRLTSDIAHELRTPLTSLAGTLETIQSGVWQATPARIASLQQDVAHVSLLIDRFSELNRYDVLDKPLNKTEFDLGELLLSILSQFECSAQQQNTKLVYKQERFFVLADQTVCSQIFSNIISNAVKYTYNGEINIHFIRDIHTNQNKQNTYRRHQQGVVISDTGVGIPKKDLPYIFERLYRSDISRSSKTGGTGIGLSIALAAANAHGWEISAQSEQGKGSSFTVWIQ